MADVSAEFYKATAPVESHDGTGETVRKMAGLGGEGYPEPPGKPPAFGLPTMLALSEKFSVSSVVASETPGCVQTPGWYRVHFTCGGGSGWTYMHAESPEAAQAKLAGPGNFLNKESLCTGILLCNSLGSTMLASSFGHYTLNDG